MHRLPILAALIALAPTPLLLTDRHPTVTANPVTLDPGRPERTRLGRLTYLAGWALRGGDRRFGGVSSMTIQDGHFVMLSDGGVVTRFRFRGTGRVADYAMSELPGAPGGGISKIDRDSESSTYDPASGHVWAGFETSNQIWRYTKGFVRADGHVAPALMADWPGNLGAEAMVRLRDGRFLVFAEEKKRKDGSHFALLFPGDPVAGSQPVVFGYRGPSGFAVTDAAQLPDGRVMILHRKFSPLKGFAAALTIIDPDAILPGGDVVGESIAELAPPLTVDNMEALAITRSRGRTIVWIASDDNYFVAERTLLLAFALDPKA